MTTNLGRAYVVAALLSVLVAQSSAYAVLPRGVRICGPPNRVARPSMDLQSDSVEHWLQDCSAAAHDGLNEVLLAIVDSCKLVSEKIGTASCDSTSCFSTLPGELYEDRDDDEEDGGEMLAIDLLAEEVLFAALARTGRVAVASSESDQLMRHLQVAPTLEEASEGSLPPSPPFFSVSLDPLDGASIIDTNFAVGTIFAVYRGSTLRNVTGRELLAAGACCYGPRTTLTLGLADEPGAHEFLLMNDRWLPSNVYEGMREHGKLCAPGNLRATASNERYAALVRLWQQDRYTLRYTGGLVTDVMQLLIKRHGIFASAPAEDERPSLLLLHEAIPMAFLVEKARGASSDGTGTSLLDLRVVELDARTQVALGSPGDVQRFDEVVGAWVGAAHEGRASTSS